MYRGDRFSWTGDAHVAQATALVSLGNYAFIRNNIALTASQSNGIESYSLYWVLSVLDYYRFTGDTAVRAFTHHITSHHITSHHITSHHITCRHCSRTQTTSVPSSTTASPSTVSTLPWDLWAGTTVLVPDSPTLRAMRPTVTTTCWPFAQ